MSVERTVNLSAATVLSEGFLRRFESPPAGHRPQVFMVWNGTVNRSYITRALEEFRDAGMGGVFVHPRPGMVTEYLSPEWFSLWNFAAAEAKRLGLECHIYDENSYPAGFAGGHVPAMNPLTVTQALQPRFHRAAPVAVAGDLVAAFRVEGDHTLKPVDRGELDKAVADGPVMTLSLTRDSGGLWQGGFPYVDLTLPDTTRTFLEVTHDAYAAHAREHFGSTCKYAFSDEPMLRPRSGWVLSRYLVAAFQREHGYDLMSRLADLIVPTDEGRAVRFDYQMTVQRLFEQNFAEPMSRWCGEHGLAFTGHYMEHEWPSPQSHPSAMSLLRYMQVPGNDLLGFQFDPAKSPQDNAIWELNLTELRSVEAQMGAARTLCETCGGGGYAFTIRDIKPCEDFAMACGVNLVNPHLSHQTLAGARRYDWAQTVSPHSPWFEAYRPQGDHVGRVQTALLAGRGVSRVLVLMPTTSAWLDFVPSSARLPGYVDTLTALRQSQTTLVRHLASHLIDFDLGDELMLRDLGRVDGGKLRLGEATYEAVVVPEGMANVLPSTMELLGKLPGERVLALRQGPEFVGGRRVAGRQGWGGDVKLLDRGQLVPALRQLCPPRVRTPEGTLPETVLHLSRRLEGEFVPGTSEPGYVHFFANPYRKAAPLTLHVRAGSLVELDTATGGGRVVASADAEGWCALSTELPAGGHLLLAAVPGKAPVQSPARPKPVEVTLGVPSLRRTGENILVLDYCDLTTAAGTQLTSVPCIRAEAAIWQDHGFDQNPWRWAIQYRRTYLDATFPQPSGFELTYRFSITPGVDLKSLRVAVERPQLYEVRLNGQPVSVANGEVWFDEEIRAASVAVAARVGENVLSLRANRMHPLCEVTPPYVLGDFAAVPAERGFTLAPPKPLAMGNLIGQGLPFANRGVVAAVPVRLASRAARVRVALGEWAGSVVGVRLGEDACDAWITTSPGEVVLEGPFDPGDHTLHLDLRGHLKNQIGPWHKAGLPIPWTWEAAPSPQPPGEKYLLTPWGVMGGLTASAEA